MATTLMRTALCPLYESKKGIHPGLLLQRGLCTDDQQAKTTHVERIARHVDDGFYRRAYNRWGSATDDPTRFRSVVLKIRTRLFIGLMGGGMLETGCLISHSCGMPYLPGSSVKGVVASHARDRLGETGGKFCDELFGAPATDDGAAALSGLIVFHDAWWAPDTLAQPLVQEIVTTHHPDYYGSAGKEPATDFDSPIPNAQVAVQGAFRFVIEGPAEWLEMAERMLTSALTTRGAGAKTRAGYGLFAAPESDGTADSDPPTDPGHDWVNSKIAELSAKPGVQKDHALRGKALAEAWDLIEDPALKQAAFADIRERWTEKGWWDAKQSGAARKAMEIYGAYRMEKDET